VSWQSVLVCVVGIPLVCLPVELHAVAHTSDSELECVMFHVYWRHDTWESVRNAASFRAWKLSGFIYTVLLNV
jgi:hypothetical protein